MGIAYIYKIQNKLDNKIYIGCTNDPDRRWKEHLRGVNKDKENKCLYNAMREHGKENFIFEIIETCTEEDKFEIEDRYIKKFNTTDREYGYNMIEQLKVTIGLNVEKDFVPNIDFKYSKDKKYIESELKKRIYKEKFYEKYKIEKTFEVREIIDGEKFVCIADLGGEYEPYKQFLISDKMRIKNLKTGRIIKSVPNLGKYVRMPVVYAMIFDTENYNNHIKNYVRFNYYMVDTEIHWVIRGTKFCKDYNAELMNELINEGVVTEGNNVFYNNSDDIPFSKAVENELNHRISEGLGTKERERLGININLNQFIFITYINKFKDKDNYCYEKSKEIEAFIKSIKDEMKQEIIESGLTKEVDFIDDIEVLY